MNFRDLITWKGNKDSKDLSSSYVDPFYGLQRDMNRVFDSFFDDFKGLRSLKTGDITGFTPKVNLSETEKEIKVEVELPGLEEKDVDITLNEDTLIIKGEKKIQKEDKKENYHVVESSYGSFYRAIVLPPEIAKDKIDAHYKNGVFTIMVPKTETAKATTKKITVKKD